MAEGIALFQEPGLEKGGMVPNEPEPFMFL
jgi:hypothetical protein